MSVGRVRLKVESQRKEKPMTLNFFEMIALSNVQARGSVTANAATEAAVDIAHKLEGLGLIEITELESSRSMLDRFRISYKAV
jgi:hypothetical protein